MSNKTPNDGALQSTKQMLDELDALMERMLSLPVNDLDSAPPFPQDVVKAPHVAPALAAKLTLLESPAGAAPTTNQSHPVFNPPHLGLPADAGRGMPEDTSYLSEPEPLSNNVVPPSFLSKLEPLLAAIPESEKPLMWHWGYGPLVWINQGFDRWTLFFGGVGEWLRGQAGRTALGLSGVVLTLAAFVWFLKDWLGWN